MSRQERIGLHTNQKRMQASNSMPAISEITEGKPIFRETHKGLYQYVRYNNDIYSQLLTRHTRTLEEEINDTVKNITIEEITLSGILDVTSGGTGLATITDGAVMLGSGAGAVTPLAVTTDGDILIGDGTTDPTTYSAFSSATGTLKVSAGGTGLATVASNRILTGNGTGALTAEANLTFSGTQLTVAGDLRITEDDKQLSIGEGNDFTFTHDDATGGTIAGNPVTITSGGAATWSTSAGNLTVDAAAAVLVLDGHTGITLDASNSGNIEINVTAADDILIGNDAVAQDILIGNAAATQVDLTAILVDINGGSSGVTIDGDVNINSYALTNSDPYTVSIKPNNSTQHMTMGLADKQNNYSLLGIYSAAAASIAGVTADAQFDNWPIP